MTSSAYLCRNFRLMMREALYDISHIKLEGLAWRLFDCRDQILGRFAAQIAIVLMGKDKPTFNPADDRGDVCVVVNAKHIQLVGSKGKTKKYIWHTGYVGHLREKYIKQVMIEDPTEVVRLAVLGMIPNNKLRRTRRSKLQIFPDERHPFGDRCLQPFVMPLRKYSPTSWFEEKLKRQAERREEKKKAEAPFREGPELPKLVPQIFKKY